MTPLLLTLIYCGLLLTSAASLHVDYPPRAATQRAFVARQCAHGHARYCQNWKIGEWLPELLDGFDPTRQGKAVSVGFFDGFMYEGRTPHGDDYFSAVGYPADATPFGYGVPVGNVAYDYAHAVVYYSLGCCSWGSTVLAAGVGRRCERFTASPSETVLAKSSVSTPQSSRDRCPVTRRCRCFPTSESIQKIAVNSITSAS